MDGRMHVRVILSARYYRGLQRKYCHTVTVLYCTDSNTSGLGTSLEFARWLAWETPTVHTDKSHITASTLYGQFSCFPLTRSLFPSLLHLKWWWTQDRQDYRRCRMTVGGNEQSCCNLSRPSLRGCIFDLVNESGDIEDTFCSKLVLALTKVNNYFVDLSRLLILVLVRLLRPCPLIQDSVTMRL